MGEGLLCCYAMGSCNIVLFGGTENFVLLILVNINQNHLTLRNVVICTVNVNTHRTC